MKYMDRTQSMLFGAISQTGVVPIYALNASGATYRWTYIPLIGTSITVGTGKMSRMGHQIQLRSLEFHGTLETVAQETVVRWAILKSKDVYARGQIGDPRQFLSPRWDGGTATEINTEYWNTNWIDSATQKKLPDNVTATYDTFWRNHFKIIRTGRIDMPTFKLSTSFDIRLKFSVGYRPIVDFGDDDTTNAPIKNEYNLVMWANVPPSFTGDTPAGALTEGACLRNCWVRATYFDA